MALHGGLFARLHALCYLFFARLVLFSSVFVRGALCASESIISQSMTCIVPSSECVCLPEHGLSTDDEWGP